MDRIRKFRRSGRVVIESDVEIGAHAAVDRPAFGETRIGAGTKIDNLVQVAHGVKIGRHALLAAQSGVAGSTALDDGVILAGQSGVTGHVHVGRGVVVGAKSVVTKDIDAGQHVTGIPAIDVDQWRESAVLLRRLPDLRKTLTAIDARLAALEAAGNKASNDGVAAVTRPAARHALVRRSVRRSLCRGAAGGAARPGIPRWRRSDSAGRAWPRPAPSWSAISAASRSRDWSRRCRSCRSRGGCCARSARRRVRSAPTCSSRSIFPDFNFRLLPVMRALGVPIVYYVSPQLWAWRAGRLETIKRYVDQMLVIFPFEAAMYREAGVPVEFVGHPLLDLAPTPEARATFLAGQGLDPDASGARAAPGQPAQ